MKEAILSGINNPDALEKLYRENKSGFKQEFKGLYPTLSSNALADFWLARLNYEADDISWGTRRELLLVITVSFVAGFIARIPAFFPVSEDFFYPRNIGFIVFPALVAYFAWREKVSTKTLVLLFGLMGICLSYINLLPAANESDTLILACLHLPLLLWFILGAAFTGDNRSTPDKWLGYLRFNGELIVMTTIILISGAILSGVTIGLFTLTGINIEQFYLENVAIFGVAATPVVGSYLTQTNPQLVNKVSPVIARVFSPLVLIMLVVYLFATLFSAKNLYHDRDFLIMFNLLLVGVMALIFFSVAEASRGSKGNSGSLVLFLLAVLTILVNGFALSAIFFRITEWGITPNRLAVLGANILMLVNLVLVTVELYRCVTRKSAQAQVGNAIAAYLPIYALWAAIVVFFFPWLFGLQ